MPDKTGSNRIGWNRRGPTDAILFEEAKELSDPMSYHWENKARNLAQALIEKMGAEQYDEWLFRLHDEDDVVTWKELAELLEPKLNIISGKWTLERLRAELGECSCQPDLPDGRSNGSLCYACKMENSFIQTEEIPF